MIGRKERRKGEDGVVKGEDEKRKGGYAPSFSVMPFHLFAYVCFSTSVCLCVCLYSSLSCPYTARGHSSITIMHRLFSDAFLPVCLCLLFYVCLSICVNSRLDISIKVCWLMSIYLYVCVLLLSALLRVSLCVNPRLDILIKVCSLIPVYLYAYVLVLSAPYVCLSVCVSPRLDMCSCLLMSALLRVSVSVCVSSRVHLSRYVH